jgi:plasmid stability protein
VTTTSYRFGVRQLLLRVPDPLHAQLAARAAAEGRSANSLATEILTAALDGPPASRTARLRAKAVSLSMLGTAPAQEPVLDRDRERAVAASEGIGPVLDSILDDERDL